MNNNNTTMAATTATTIADESTTTSNNNNRTHATTAQVTFRVKCDTTTIGHGEDVYLVDVEGSKVRSSSNTPSPPSIMIIILRMLTQLLFADSHLSLYPYSSALSLSTYIPLLSSLIKICCYTKSIIDRVCFTWLEYS